MCDKYKPSEGFSVKYSGVHEQPLHLAYLDEPEFMFYRDRKTMKLMKIDFKTGEKTICVEDAS